MTTVILLAAGSSRRMGSKNKLLLPVNGEPMISHVAKKIMDIDVDRIIAVVGHQRELIEPILYEMRITTVFNKNHNLGMVSSIKCAMTNLSHETSQFMIVLGDMPLLESSHYTALLKFSEEQKKGSIVRPKSNNNEFGHPVIFAARYKDEILNCADLHSLKSVVKNNRTSFVQFETDDSAYYVDADTPSDYEKLSLCLPKN